MEINPQNHIELLQVIKAIYKKTLKNGGLLAILVSTDSDA
ncbi:hypothetical protein yberc0001_33200 [Yersinia bercovieri ATCC 43970]|uniref:Uncharacterized protein n=1 Tax=Yersinia bercovieri ATCC 43970 TaxID=349968 RepID=A0ABM9Y242_YERBE|nr:hypothetical protein yberc0001_33200 [Yersinia bercovieri ATCC 43970]CFQ39314.1 Uncharacterised protein [Yersinia bercovieri]